MKKTLFTALMGLGLTASLHAAVGDTFTYEGLDYNILSEDDLTCEVGINTNKFKGDLVIPSKVSYNDKEYTVTAIGTQAFFLDTSLTSITIPETVTAIKSEALSRVFNITELVIPNSVTEIGDAMAFACNKLEHITLSSSCREIPHHAFSGLAYLKEIVLPEGVEIIDGESFNYCSRATKLTISSTVKSIGKMAFAGWNALTELTIPANVEELAEEAFSYCFSNKSATITFEESETPIILGKNVFGQGLYAGAGDDPTGKIETLYLNRPWNCASTNIDEMPFTNRLWLKTINLGKYITSLPANTFNNNKNKWNLVEAVNIYSKTCPVAANENIFQTYVYNKAVLTVPGAAVDAYKADPVWGKFIDIQGTKTVFIGEQGYATLADAIKDAKSGDTIILTEDATMPTSMDAPLASGVTFRSADAENPCTIFRNQGNSYVLATAANFEVNFVDVILDGNNKPAQSPLFMCASQCKIGLYNVEIANANAGKDGLIWLNNKNASLTAENLVFTNCEVAEGAAFINDSGLLDVKGECVFTVFLGEKSSGTGTGGATGGATGGTSGTGAGTGSVQMASINDSGLTEGSEITILFDPEKLTVGKTVVNHHIVGDGSINADYYVCGVEGYEFIFSGQNLVLAKKSGLEEIMGDVDADAPVTVYNLNGVAVRVNVPASEALNGVAGGIYIVNGKKILVK